MDFTASCAALMFRSATVSALACGARGDGSSRRGALDGRPGLAGLSELLGLGSDTVVFRLTVVWLPLRGDVPSGDPDMSSSDAFFLYTGIRCRMITGGLLGSVTIVLAACCPGRLDDLGVRSLLGCVVDVVEVFVEFALVVSTLRIAGLPCFLLSEFEGECSLEEEFSLEEEKVLFTSLTRFDLSRICVPWLLRLLEDDGSSS